MSRNNSYNFILQEIKDSLRNKNKNKYEEQEIEEAILNIKLLIETITYSMYSKIKCLDYILENLTEEDWKNIKKDLEKFFDIEMDEAIFITGREQQKVDKTWWTHKAALSENNFYWNRYKEYLKKILNDSVVSTLNIDTDNILNNIGDPNLDSFERFGLVIGHVQSGKTSNYSAVINKATDAGYKFIVVIAGTLDNLRNQTQNRLVETYVGINSLNQKEGVGHFSGSSSHKAPVVLTGPTEDFKKSYADKLFSYDNISKPILLVIKKNVKVLEALNNWLDKWNNSTIKDRPLLVIDDESDYASINTNDEESPTQTNARIRKLLYKFKKFSYVAYTATPYANILINHETENLNNEKDLFPRDFICTLKAPTNYFGSEKIFINEKDKYLRLIDENNLKSFLPEKHKNTYQIKDDLPKDLKEAITCFYLNIGIRKLRKQGHKHNSMLIHLSRFTNIHEQLFKEVSSYSELLTKHIKSYILDDNYATQSALISAIEKIYKKEYQNCGFEWDLVRKSLYEIANKIIVCGEYLGSNKRIEYRDDISTNIIAIGGLSLSRGFTLEGLSITYFSRTTIFYDSLMQMGRWFGYRDGYDDLCKIYTSEEIADYFAHIFECTMDLVDRIKQMNYERKTPEEFGLYIKKDPSNILQVTAKNKQKHSAEYELCIDYQGKLKETLFISNDKEINERNLILLKQFIKNIKVDKNESSKINLWNDVSTNAILDFIESFELPDIKIAKNSKIMSSITQFNKEILKKYIENYASFDIALYKGDGEEEEVGNLIVRKQKRNIYEQAENKRYKLHDGGRVSSGEAEFVVFNRETINEIKDLSKKEDSKRSDEIRSRLERPLLMLHIIEDSKDFSKSLPAYGISFPKSDKIETKTYKVTLNTVSINQILRDQEEEELESND
ncbi:MAG: Z1 domain-containing protein [Cetobacterium sp.]